MLRKDAPPVNEPTRVSAEEAERTIRQKLGSKRILLVEDEPINREIAQACWKMWALSLIWQRTGQGP